MMLFRLARDLLYLFFLSLVCSSIPALENVREIPLRLNHLVYDRQTEKIYATSPDETNSVLQIDPKSIAITRIEVGSLPGRLALGSQGELWVALNGEGVLARIDLNTLAAAIEKVWLGTNVLVQQMAVSKVAPPTLAVALTGSGAPQGGTFLIRNGAYLPAARTSLVPVALHSGYLYGWGDWGLIRRAAILPNAFSLDENWIPDIGGEFEIYENRIYAATGAIIDSNSLDPITPVRMNDQSAAAELAIASGHLYFLRYRNTGLEGLLEWSLHTFDRDTHLQTNGRLFPIGTFSSTPRHLVAWGTNGLAFQTDDRLFLLNADEFPTADLEIEQTVSPSPMEFGGLETYSLVVSNKGPGVAVNVHISTSFSSNVFLLPDFHSATYTDTTVEKGFMNIPAGETVKMNLHLISPPGTVTNEFTVTSSNDPFPGNNHGMHAQTVRLPLDEESIRLTFTTPHSITYHTESRRLFISERYWGNLWSIDAGLRVEARGIGDISSIDLLGGETDPLLNIRFTRDDILKIGRWIPDLNYIAEIAHAHPAEIGDIEVSPAEPGLLAIADLQGVTLYRNGVRLPTLFAKSGTIEFSKDGRKLYHLDGMDCALSTLRVNGDVLELEQTRTNAPCTDFALAGDLLYFASGEVYDPAVGDVVGRLAGVGPTSFVLPHESGNIDALTRTNGSWVARRFSPGKFNFFAETPVPGLGSDTPLKVTSWGDGLAVQTSSEVFLVGLRPAPNELSLRVAQTGTNQIVLEAFGASNGRFELHRSATLGAISWDKVAELFGDGGLMRYEVPPGGSAGFFRIVRVD